MQPKPHGQSRRSLQRSLRQSLLQWHIRGRRSRYRKPKTPSPAMQGKLAFNLQVDARSDGRGFPYYWLKFGERAGAFIEGTDIHALKHNKISVTPLKLDLTDYSVTDRVARALGYGAQV